MATRIGYFIGFLLVCGILGTSLYLQYYDGIQPCPLCSLQRVAFCVLGIIFLLGFIFSKLRFMSIAFSFLGILFSIAGFGLAARQTWLQLDPTSGSNECGVSLQYMLQALPWHEVANKIFSGSAECATKSWEFLSLSMPEWASIWFAVFFCFSALIFIRELRHK